MPKPSVAKVLVPDSGDIVDSGKGPYARVDYFPQPVKD
jgi:hypothetical protein